MGKRLWLRSLLHVELFIATVSVSILECQIEVLEFLVLLLLCAALPVVLSVAHHRQSHQRRGVRDLAVVLLRPRALHHDDLVPRIVHGLIFRVPLDLEAVVMSVLIDSA